MQRIAARWLGDCADGLIFMAVTCGALAAGLGGAGGFTAALY
jgi:hypothetical protein